MSKFGECVMMFGYVLRAMLCFAAAGILLYAFIGFVQCKGFAAPVPPPPRAMRAEDLPGRWDYRWGDMKAGQVVFEADGFYYSRHSPGWEATYCGRWELKDGTLILSERSVNSCFVGFTTYTVKLSRSMPGYAKGKYNEATDVVIWNRRDE